jgi:hypothetical protein
VATVRQSLAAADQNHWQAANAMAALRDDHGWSLRQIAEAVGCGKTTVDRHLTWLRLCEESDPDSLPSFTEARKRREIAPLAEPTEIVTGEIVDDAEPEIVTGEIVDDDPEPTATLRPMVTIGPLTEGQRIEHFSQPRELRKLAERKGWHASYQRGTWALVRMGDSAEALARFLLGQPDAAP